MHPTMPPADPIWESIRQTGLLNGRRVVLLKSIESTNLTALDLGKQGAPAGTLVLAECQSGGRGRLGRQWLSPPGTGLYLSILLRPALEPADFPKITLAAGLAVCRAVENSTGTLPRIKWPNDLLLEDRKFCGILSESGPLAGNRPLVVLGIGCNLSTPLAAFPEELRPGVTSLALHWQHRIERGTLLAAILAELDLVLPQLEQGGFDNLLAAWRQRDGLAGRHLTWVTPEGGVVSGVALGPDREGILHLRDDRGEEHEVLSGDLRLASR